MKSTDTKDVLGETAPCQNRQPLEEGEEGII